MKRLSRSHMPSFAVAAVLAVASLSSSSAHAMITATGPKATNSGTNNITIGAWNFLGYYFLAKCEDGAFALLTNSSGAAIQLGTSPNLTDHLDLQIFQNGNDDVRRVPTGGSTCSGVPMQTLQSNGYYIQMSLSGGNDYTPNFNMGGPMVVYGGGGNDGITINSTSSPTLASGDAGGDDLYTYGNSQDLLLGGDGDDFLRWAGPGFNRCDGGANYDKCSSSTCATGQMVNCERYRDIP